MTHFLGLEATVLDRSYTQQIRAGSAILAGGTSSVWRPTRIGPRTDALLTIYSHPPQTSLKRLDVYCHKFADDVVLYTFFTDSATGDLDAAMSRLKEAFDDARTWLLTDRLQLKDTKTTYLCVISLSNVAKYDGMAIRLDEMCI